MDATTSMRWNKWGNQVVVELAAYRSPDSIPRLSLPVSAGGLPGPFQWLVDSVNTNAAVYNPAVAIIPNGIKIAGVAI